MSNNPQIFESTDSVQLDNIVFSNLIQLSLISQEHNSTCNDHVICDSMELTDDLDSENDRDLEDDNPFLKDSLFMKLKMSLTQNKQDLIDKCCGEVRGITEQNEQKDIKNTPESIKCIVAKYLEKEVMLNLKCSCCNKTVTNTVFEEIKDLTSGSHISNRSNTFVFDNFPCQSKDQNCNK